MSWFLSRSQGRADDRAMEERILSEAALGGPARSDEPALILLAADAEGPTCRRLHCFDNAESAARFVRFWYPYRLDDSVGGFWLLRSEPLPVDRAEWGVVVLTIVRGQNGTVYAFSRRDMAATRELLSEEIAYGLDPGSVILSWAVPVEIETDFRGDATIFPRSLPEGVTAGNPAISTLDQRRLAAAPALWKVGGAADRPYA